MMSSIAHASTSVSGGVSAKAGSPPEGGRMRRLPGWQRERKREFTPIHFDRFPVDLSCFYSAFWRLVPGGAQYPEPVFAADFSPFLVTISGGFQRGNELLQPRCILDFVGTVAPSKSDPIATPSMPRLVDEMVDMPNHIRQRRIGVLAPIGAAAWSQRNSSRPALALRDRIKLLVGEVSGDRCKRVNVRMAGDKRLVLSLGNVPETFLGNVREIDDDAQPVASSHQLETGLSSGPDPCPGSTWDRQTARRGRKYCGGSTPARVNAGRRHRTLRARPAPRRSPRNLPYG